MIAVHGYSAPQTGAAYSRARALCERLGEAEPLVATLSGEFVYYFVRGDYSVMRRLTDEARQVAERLQARLSALPATAWPGITGPCTSGRLPRHGPSSRRSCAFTTRVGIGHSSVHYVHDPKVSALTYLAPVLWMLGFPEQARRSSTAAFHCAAELDQADLTAHVHNFAGAGLDELLGDVPGVQAHAEAIIELADRRSLGYMARESANSSRLGYGPAGCSGARHRAHVSECRATARLKASSWYQARYLCMLAAAYAQVGQAGPGLRIVSEAEHLIAEKSGTHVGG